MMQQAEDFLTECEAIYAVIEKLPDEAMAQKTDFKDWTIDEIIRHLHFWNMAAYLSFREAKKFKHVIAETLGNIKKHRDKGPSPIRYAEAEYLDNLSGAKLVQTWRAFYQDIAAAFGEADPSDRVEWVGPSMSLRSSVTARLMETWSHAQAIYDVLGDTRANADHIRNIVQIGFNTYGWTFKVNGEDAPDPVPYLELTAPSGDLWQYGTPSDAERIEGLAEEFCQVVTQTRNIADTKLQVTGPNATRWMSIAQCFAGGAEPPPAAGTRVIRSVA